MTESKPQQCSWTGCNKPSRASFENRSLCIDHFLELSQRSLKLIEQELEHEPDNRNLPPGTHNLLPQMISQMSLLAVGTKLLHPNAREKLISLSATASALHKRVLRPPRFARHVQCLLRTGIVSTEAPETCRTVNISQRGACVEVQRPFGLNQVITLERLDTGDRARAKVVWMQEKAGMTYTAGLEILDPEDFWGLTSPR